MNEYNFDVEKFKEDFESGKVYIYEYPNEREIHNLIKSMKISFLSYYSFGLRICAKYNSTTTTIYYFKDLPKYYPLPKQQSLFEQALDLLGIKIKEEFELDLPYKGIAICRINKYGELQYKCNRNAWLSESLTLADLFLQNRKLTPIKPKSEAELILDELHKVVGKASYILERNGR